MKLLSKYSRINLLAFIAIFIIASAAYYFTLNYLFVHQVDEDLKIEEQEIRSFVAEHNRMPEVIKVEDQVISFSQIPSSFKKRHFSTIEMVDPTEVNGKPEPFRQLEFGVFADQVYYRVTVSKSMEQTRQLLNSVLLISFITILSILGISLLINRVLLKRLWMPFYKTLDKVNSFRLSDNASLKLDHSPIEEFEFMNRTLEHITQQTLAEYITLKTFSENASHEMQTPLAVIRSKLDLLIQDQHLTESQSRILEGTYRSIQKLTSLNQSLLLLARIDNRQYELKLPTSFKQRLEEKVQEFQELWNNQQITVDAEFDEATVIMNPQLADILFNNLLSNATRYNFPGGEILIELRPSELIISNTGKEISLDKDLLYKRFYKPGITGDHNGLGLSIIKQICDVSDLTIDYSFAQNRHRFSIKWKN